LPVGTTTIRLGATLQGPSAPVACQSGKKEVLTSTGVPVRSTWKEMVSSVWVTAVTVAAGSGTAVGALSPTGTRSQVDGPPAAGTTSHRDGSSYQLTAGASQLPWLGPTPCHTTGRLVRGWTSDESRTS